MCEKKMKEGGRLRGKKWKIWRHDGCMTNSPEMWTIPFFQVIHASHGVFQSDYCLLVGFSMFQILFPQ